MCFRHIRLGVSDVMLQPFLEGWPLHQVIEAKRLFMVDLEILQDLSCKSDDFVVTVFFLNLYFCEIIRGSLLTLSNKFCHYKHQINDVIMYSLHSAQCPLLYFSLMATDD